MFYRRGAGVLLAGLIVLSACATEQPQGTRERLNAQLGLDRAVGRATRADVLQAWGPPAQRLTQDGDEFWIYKQAYVASQDPMAQFWAGIGGLGAGLAGYTFNPVLQQAQQPTGTRLIILRFDGKTGVLKAWSLRE